MKRSSNSTTKGFIRQTILLLMMTLFGFSLESMAQMSCVCAADKKTGKMSCSCTDKNAKATVAPKASVTKVARVAPCPVKHKAVAHKRKRVSSERVAFKPKTVMRSTNWAATTPCEPLCWGYRKNNIFVTECPGLMFDQKDRLYIGGVRSWSGYRSPAVSDTLRRMVPVLVAPQSNVIDNYDGPVAPASGNFTTPDTDVKLKYDNDYKIKSDGDYKIKSDEDGVKVKSK